MLENTFGLSFFLKAKKGTDDEERYVFMRLTVDGQTKELSTKIAWQKSRWSQQNGRALGNKVDARKLNSYLDSLQMKVLQAKQVLLDKGKEITAEGIKNLLLGKIEEYKMMLEVLADHNRKMESLLGTEYAEGTLERFETALVHTRSFIRWKFGKEDFELR